MQGRERDPLRVVRRVLPQTLSELATFGTVAAIALLPLIERRDRSCRIAERTGQPCPLCGGTRAVHALRHGNVPTAWSANKLVTAAAAVGVAALPTTVLRRV
jgi:hypothetical protein